MIISFKCRETEKIFDGGTSRKFPVEVSKIGKRKLDIIEAAFKEQDLSVPPANRFEERLLQHKDKRPVQDCFQV